MKTLITFEEFNTNPYLVLFLDKLYFLNNLTFIDDLGKLLNWYNNEYNTDKNKWLEFK